MALAPRSLISLAGGPSRERGGRRQVIAGGPTIEAASPSARLVFGSVQGKKDYRP
jgi:hypothetical protein